MGVAKKEPFKKRLHLKPLGSKGPNMPREEKNKFPAVIGNHQQWRRV
jgi:hypothetical protein